MKAIFVLLILITTYFSALGDIAPNPIEVKGIYTVDSCKIQMVSEIVTADLYKDSAIVECSFELLNLGDSISIEVGFPVMYFHYYDRNILSFDGYSDFDKKVFKIIIDRKILNEEQIRVPKELDSLYKICIGIIHIEHEYKRKLDSIYKTYNTDVTKNPSLSTRLAFDSLTNWRESKPRFNDEIGMGLYKKLNNGKFPWYIWDAKFSKLERKTIKVVYSMPSGLEYGGKRYFKYLLQTGSGWYSNIEKANIILKLHDIRMRNIEEISPANFNIDYSNKSIIWNINNFEPYEKDDIYIRYYDYHERKAFEKFMNDFKLRKFFRFINPLNWF